MLADFSVRKPYTVVVAVILIIILGVVSFMNMSTDLLPSINLPYTVIVTSYPGASPEQVEMAVTRPIEQTMASISNIKEVRSISREHMSLVILEFSGNTNMDSAVIEMRESLDMIESMLPEQAGSPIIMKINPDMMPIMVLSAAVKGQEISKSSDFLEKSIIPELESVEGVAAVSASGLVDNQVIVTLNEKKINEVNQKIKQALMAQMAAAQGLPAGNVPAGADMAAQAGQASQAGSAAQAGSMSRVPAAQIPEIKVTKDMISGILKGQNFSMPAGYISEGEVDYLIRTGDKIRDLEELKSLPILKLPVPGMDPVVLQDVADVELFADTGNMYSKVNGNDAITLTIQKQTGYNTADVARSVRKKIDEIMGKNPDVEIASLMDQGEYVDIVIDSVIKNIIIGGLLAILILILFLRDVKPMIVIGLAIPISLVTAFVMMYFGKITLNIISMGGLALGVGMLVDNSIVVIENIYRMRNEGKSATEAAIEGTKQVAAAITSSTLTTIAVFLPIVFTEGFTRQIFTDMGLTIAFSLLASLLIALTLVPMAASKILARETKKEHRFFERMKRGYIRTLRFSLRHKWVVILIVIALFAGSIAGIAMMGTELFPPVDSGQVTMSLTMPQGTGFKETADAADKIMNILMDIDEVETVGASMGGGMFGAGAIGGMRSGGSGNSVSFYLRLKKDRTRTTDEVAELIRKKTDSTDYEISVSSAGMDLSALSGGRIVVEIRGREFDTLEKIAKDVSKIVASVDGTTEVSEGIEETAPEIRIVVDKEKSIAAGLTVAQVYMEINKLLADESAVTTLSTDGGDYDIFVRDAGDTREYRRSDIMELEIENAQGTKVKLKNIASIKEAEGFASISRTNQQRYVSVRAGLKEGYNIGIVSNEIKEKLDSYEVPEGYSVTMSGENEMIEESFSDLGLMLAMAVAFVYLIMVAQFQSLLSPFIVMFTIPLAFTGGFLGLIITGMPLGIVAFVGLIVLAGVVVNNGIVFVDYANKMREEGMSMEEALVKTGNDRIRPILMTALTTIFALITTSFGAGEGTELVQPMAITTIAGLLYATFLTLLLVPVLYAIFYRKKAAKA